MTAPLECVRMQLMVGKNVAAGPMQILSETLAKGGPLALFNGNLTDVIRVAPSKAIQLWSFDTYKRVLRKRNRDKVLLAQILTTNSSELPLNPITAVRRRTANAVIFSRGVMFFLQQASHRQAVAFSAG
eukprot:gene21102-25338_t